MALIAGVDEAGRGPLAGPVVAAAVILPEEHTIEGLRDSKKLSPKKRESLFDIIREKAIAVGVGTVDSKTIDQINIRQATFKAMQMALGRLKQKPDKALVDGEALPSQIIPNEGIIKGDDLVDAIKAASIIAKVTRDRVMCQYDVIFPEYGFARHKGYGTRAHMDALAKWKATPIHRKTFSPVPDHWPSLNWYRKQRRIGWLGERLVALKYLAADYRIIDMNVNCSPFGEIDLVTEKDSELIFVEVKTISKEQLGAPEFKIDASKLSKLEKAIDVYIMRHDVKKDIRLDAVAVSLIRGIPRFKYFQGIEMDIF